MLIGENWFSYSRIFILFTIIKHSLSDDNDYNLIHRDGSYQFGYETPDSFHHSEGNRRNMVRGRFGSRNPATGQIDSTVYTAGRRGFRPRGKNIVRKYDLSQDGPLGPIGSADDPYYDPFEDPSYKFGFKTRTYSRQEEANSLGDVNGKYTYLDDIGERHNVEFVAGKRTGFHVKTAFPDSVAAVKNYVPLYYRGRDRSNVVRGKTAIQHGQDGSYRFVSAGPDQRRTEVSDSSGNVRGSYTYVDDKGVQHSVHYIAGPGTGYKVLKNVKGPHLPKVFPFQYRPYLDYYDNDYFPYYNKEYLPPTTIRPHFPIRTTTTKSTPINDEFPKSNSDDFHLDRKVTTTARPPKPKPFAEFDSDTDIMDYAEVDKDFNLLFGDEESKSSELEEPIQKDKYNAADRVDSENDLIDSKDEDSFEEFFSSAENRNSRCTNCPNTIVTNLSNKHLYIPPGVSVKAHIQAIDIVPKRLKARSPTEQFNDETFLHVVQLTNATTNNGNNTVKKKSTVRPIAKLNLVANTVLAKDKSSTIIIPSPRPSVNTSKPDTGKEKKQTSKVKKENGPQNLKDDKNKKSN